MTRHPTADDLLKMKGRGWLVRYPVGDTTPHNGVATVAAEQWDTGVQVRVGGQVFSGVVAYTVGSLSQPRVRNDNGGGQVAGRVAWHPVPALAIGVSAARGVFVADNVREARPDAPAGYDDQRALGVDAEASWGRWLIRGEYVANAWRLPPLDAPRITVPLESRAGYLEAKVRLLPRLYAAVRGDTMRFSSIQGSVGADSWEANHVRNQADVTPETGLRMMNDLSTVVVKSYDELDRVLAPGSRTGWRRLPVVRLHQSRSRPAVGRLGESSLLPLPPTAPTVNSPVTEKGLNA